MFASGANPGFVGPETYPIIGAVFKKNNTKLGTTVNIYVGPHAGRWKGAPASDGPWILTFVSFAVNRPCWTAATAHSWTWNQVPRIVFVRNVTPCTVLEIYKMFWRKCFIHFRGKRAEETRSCQALITSCLTTRRHILEDGNLDVLINCLQMCTETVVTRRRSDGYR